MSPPPDNDASGNNTWTDGGPTQGGAQDKSFAYRQSRKAFIEACEKAGADVVGRVHPARGPDGKPLFLDAAAFGPRLAKAGVLVVAYGQSQDPKKLPGVVAYKIDSADTLSGVWATPGAKVTGTEMLKRRP